MQMKLPEDVKWIIDTLEKAGYEAYAVGGCVRDAILGREPEDWDITTSAKPLEVKALFPKTIDTGLQHGTVTVLQNHIGYEVTTYRIDGEYEDGRHPKSVEFTGNLRLDLERRDFTINAMAYNDRDGLVDAFGGVSDINKGIIRCVGNPGDRFDEDALRMLRAIRFSGQLGFTIAEATREAILSRAHHLQKISSERIRVELTKLLVSKDSAMLREAYLTGMTKYFLPEFDEMMLFEQKNPHHIYTVGEHTLCSIERINVFFGRYKSLDRVQDIPENVMKEVKNLRTGLDRKAHRILCLTMLLHDIGKTKVMTEDKAGVRHFYGHEKVSEEYAGKILRRLTFDNDTIQTVKRLVLWHDYKFGEKLSSMRKAMAKIGPELMQMLFLVQYADILSQNPKTWQKKFSVQEKSIRLWQEVLASGAVLKQKDLKITGKDLMDLGVKQGPEIGRLLRLAFSWVLDRPECNEKEWLIEEIKKELLVSED